MRIRKHMALMFAALAGAVLAPVAAHADSINIFVTSSGSPPPAGIGSIGEYTVNQATATQTGTQYPELVTGLNGSRGLALAGTDDSDMFVVNTGSSSVGEYNTGTNSTTAGAVVNASLITTGLSTPLGDAAVSPSGTQLFVANFSNNTVKEYNVSGSSATLGYSITTNLSGPDFLALSPNGQTLYVANESGTSISEFSVNASSGTFLSSFNLPNSNSPSGVAVSSSGSYLFVTSDGGKAIYEFTTGGSLVSGFGTSGKVTLNGAYGIVADSSDLFVTTDGIGVVGELTTSGATVGSESLSGGVLTNPVISGLGDSYGIALLTPEPGSLALLGLGAVGLILKRKKQKSIA